MEGFFQLACCQDSGGCINTPIGRPAALISSSQHNPGCDIFHLKYDNIFSTMKDKTGIGGAAH
jgi:hypothetical protein